MCQTIKFICNNPLLQSHIPFLALIHRVSISSKKENIQYSRPVSQESGRRGGATSEMRVAAALDSRTGIRLIGWARRSTAAIMQQSSGSDPLSGMGGCELSCPRPEQIFRSAGSLCVQIGVHIDSQTGLWFLLPFVVFQ